MLIIENDNLIVYINPFGAELSKIYNKKTNLNYLWNGNPNYWEGQAPILFPIIGKLKKDYIIINGNKFKLPKHGFARDSTFTVSKKEATKVVLELHNSKTTYINYPYLFCLQVSYELIENTLSVTHKVINKDTKEMYFSLGGHPAFNCPLTNKTNFEDYYLEFEKEEQATLFLINMDTGLCSGETKKIKLTKNLHLNYNLFERDALIFENLQSKKISLKSNKHNFNISMTIDNWKYLAFWTKKDAPFICFEPWEGLPDFDNSNQDFSNKIGVRKLNAKKTFSNSYVLELQ